MSNNHNVYDIARTFFVQPDRDSELVSFLNYLAAENGITDGAFTAIGALTSAKLSFYDQEARKHVELVDLHEPLELISCMGAITIREGRHYAHAHVVLVDAKGTTRAGHLLEGRVYFAQVCVHQLEEREG